MRPVIRKHCATRETVASVIAGGNEHARPASAWLPRVHVMKVVLLNVAGAAP